MVHDIGFTAESLYWKRSKSVIPTCRATPFALPARPNGLVQCCWLESCLGDPVGREHLVD